ncbi:MAG: ATP-dependent DNA helicase [archaeon]|nr:ATP-dependent DNA helicase [archaeon]
MDDGIFPYPYRPGQKEIVDLIRENVRNGRNVVIESGTGTGKTSVSLAAALEGVSGTARKVIFLTRTKSQQRQVALEARAISASYNIISISMQGRGPATCLIMGSDPDLRTGTSEELSKLCAELKKGNGPAGKCPYYEAMDDKKLDVCIAYIRTSHPDPEEFRDFCIGLGICPYEASKRLLPYADVVSAPYAFFFMPQIRSHFYSWMGIGERDSVIIIDEAHNLIPYLRESMTYKCTMRALDLSESEAIVNGDPEIGEGLSAIDMVEVMRALIKEAQKEYLKRENDMIPPGFLMDELMTRLGTSSMGISNMVLRLSEIGTQIAEEKKARRKLPRSHLLSLSRFMISWTSCDDSSHVFLISGGKNPALEAYCLDPREAAEPMIACHSVVHMSGTLAPLWEYAGELDLFDPVCREFPSPFPLSNRRQIYVSDVTTKYEDINGKFGIFEKIRDYIVDIVSAVYCNTIVFFPSYSLMEKYIESGLVQALKRPVYYEKSEMPQSELMDQVMEFRCSSGSVFFAVSGGRISEGLDFPGKELELAIIVGIPYGRPSAKQDALIHYCQMRFGKGWDLAVKIPAVRKMRQAMGRLIRSEKDRGIAVILDARAGMLTDLQAEPVADPVAEVKKFFSIDSEKV